MKNLVSMIGFLVLLLAFFSVDVRAKDLTSNKKETLRDIKSMTIVIEDMKLPDATALQITKELIENDVTQKLQKAGIKVEPFTDLTSDLPWIYVNIHLMEHKELPGFYTFNLGLEVRQFVVLKRVRRLSFNASTWDHRLFGMISSSEAVSTVRESLNKAMDSFVDDCQTVNPVKKNKQLEKTKPKK